MQAVKYVTRFLVKEISFWNYFPIRSKSYNGEDQTVEKYTFVNLQVVL